MNNFINNISFFIVSYFIYHFYLFKSTKLASYISECKNSSKVDLAFKYTQRFELVIQALVTHRLIIRFRCLREQFLETTLLLKYSSVWNPVT